MSYQYSANGASLTERFEGFIEHPYQKKGDVPTIGFGTTFYPNGKFVKLGDPSITRAQGVEYLINFINHIAIPTILKYVQVTLNQNQVDALCDFIYNVGPGSYVKKTGFAGSHLLQAINNKSGQAVITMEFMKWVFVDGVKNQWQIQRRTAESNLYFS